MIITYSITNAFIFSLAAISVKLKQVSTLIFNFEVIRKKNFMTDAITRYNSVTHYVNVKYLKEEIINPS